MSIKHDCISIKRKELMDANPKIKTLSVGLSTIATLDNTKRNMTGQPIEYTWEETNKKGVIKTRRAKGFITHKFCPFCGKEY
jgi:hypothetical protein